MNTPLKRVLVLALALAAGAFAGILLFLRWAHGFSARVEPPRWEERLARKLRLLAHPSALRKLRNPVAANAEVLAEARAHFADHCAPCHGNDGRGRTTMGQRMYPRTPDMTLAATQSLADGELFHVIKHGVRLTGMPAWGEDTPADDGESWKLVHFIRYLPRITTEELEEMKALNPKSPEEREEEEAIELFLEGGAELTPAADAKAPKHHH